MKTESKENSGDVTLDDYLDHDMKFIDENARKRINEILNDFREQMQKNAANSMEEEKPKTGTLIILK